MKQRNSGFTLVEVVIVVLIIAILAAIIVPITLSIINSSHEAERTQDAKAIWNAAQTVFNDQLANDEHYESNNKQKGLIVNKYTKSINGTDVDINNNFDKIFSGNTCYIGTLEIYNRILNKIENKENLKTIYIAAGRYYTYYQKDDYDKSYTVYLVLFQYKDDDTVYYYDGKNLLEKWPLSSPNLTNLGKSDDFRIDNNKIYLQFYALKKSNNDDSLKYLRSIIKK